MYIDVAFDISSEKIRGKLRRYLRSMGLSMVNKSVYAGVGSYKTASLVSERAERIIEDNDNVYIVVIQDWEYSSINCTKDGCVKISERKLEVL
ncbi:CRISPR-associated endonuclease Cas2 [Sulfuracidifex tepidarius]|uniref:CRISPR-associated endoribonuclease Cas2 n=1 Tax=Sulfuracidifex tepidarius TaxID=1294262 RepID=A0A510E1D9_9CREN|nr:CRISPR-associated endonuclease Cas2 [Sulfuracidifex tepidarius]BBG25908.1 CRISPR-associated endoribonuclease Cas2 [Sulfuracidifex tepidarius]